jgi:hypothetical protein
MVEQVVGQFQDQRVIIPSLALLRLLAVVLVVDYPMVEPVDLVVVLPMVDIQAEQEHLIKATRVETLVEHLQTFLPLVVVVLARLEQAFPAVALVLVLVVQVLALQLVVLQLHTPAVVAVELMVELVVLVELVVAELVV